MNRLDDGGNGPDQSRGALSLAECCLVAGRARLRRGREYRDRIADGTDRYVDESTDRQSPVNGEYAKVDVRGARQVKLENDKSWQSCGKRWLVHGTHRCTIAALAMRHGS